MEKKDAAPTDPTYEIKGRVKDANNGNSYTDNLVVNIMKGNELFATKTTATVSGNAGCYSFDVPNGIYNIVIIDPATERTTTKLLVVEGAGQNVEDITLPDAKAQSKLTIDTSVTDTENQEADFAASVVEGLDKEAESLKTANGSALAIKVEMKMEPQKPENVDNTAKVAIEATTTGMTNTEFVDICVEKTIDGSSELMAETTNVFEVIIPYDFSGKSEIKVIRYHNDEAQIFTEVLSKPVVGSAVDQTFYKDTANNVIYLYTKKFSAYAIAYKTVSGGENNGGNVGGGCASSIEATSVKIDTPAKLVLTKEGETMQLSAAITPSYTTNKTLTWKTSDEKVLTVNKNGTVTVVGEGTAVITVSTSNGKTDSITLTVKFDEEKKDETPDNEDESNNSVTSAKVAKNTLAINAGLKVFQTGKKINISWGKVAGADGYQVYATYCGSKYRGPVKTVKNPDVTTVSITKLEGKKLVLTKNYKLYVKAYKLVDGKKVAFGKSIMAHIVGSKNTKNTNPKDIKLEKTSVTLMTGDTSTIKATVVLADSSKKLLSDVHAKEFRFASSKKKVATVDAKGIITAKKAGTCYIYVYAKNGYAKKVKVTVR